MEREILKSGGLLCERSEIKYSFITKHKKTWPVRVICPLIGVESRNYYSYLKRTETKSFDPVHGDMIEMIQKISESSDYTYGSRRMQKSLNALSFPVGRWKTAQLMKKKQAFGFVIKRNIK